MDPLRIDQPLVSQATTVSRGPNCNLSEDRARMKRTGSRFHNAFTESHPGSQRGGQGDRRLRRPRPRAKSFIYQMLSPRSSSMSSRLYRVFMLVLIVGNLVAFLASTNHHVYMKFGFVFNTVEAVTSYLFVIDYVLRVATITEDKVYVAKGPLWGRLSWAFSCEGLLDALSILPYFIDTLALDNVLPSFTWVRIFRVFLLFRTSRYARAMNTVTRVLWVNSEILGVSLFLVAFMLLFTSSLLWTTASPEEREANGITDIISAMYLAVLMLTGQGTPEGDLPAISKFVVMITAFLSVPFFAVPAAMVTWGFEGEAERLAQQQRKHYAREQLYGADYEDVVCSSESEDEGNDLEDYLDLVGGAENPDSDELEKRALEFFETAHAGAPLLPEARRLAGVLETSRLRARRHKQLQADALTLLGQAVSLPEEQQSMREEALEHRLQLFHTRVLAERAGPLLSAEQHSEELTVAGELRALREELAALRSQLGTSQQ
eukprot:TRINITY_DN100975_c0_g1_i1.p1 TRINITY_DN100975_c0_g1~~TRINITY_DN100975_c0_g1_i1.p1  ORF type:complete len:490 (+),score=79.17 TRINITY_DN100975_c0_g1_i1:58-1527(+)